MGHIWRESEVGEQGDIFFAGCKFSIADVTGRHASVNRSQNAASPPLFPEQWTVYLKDAFGFNRGELPAV